MSLTRSILESHGPPPPPGRAAPLRQARPDALLVDATHGRVALGRHAARDGESPAIELIAALDRDAGSASTGALPEEAAFESLARRCGARVVPPRAGDLRALILDALAAPGRLYASTAPLPEAGALGALAIRVGEIEAATLLAGEWLDPGPIRVVRVRLAGECPARCEGWDIAAALLARWPGAWDGAWVEFEESALERTNVPERITIARALADAGARSVLFPSDDKTRQFLAARGRESDWRRTDPGPEAESARLLDLAWVVPHGVRGAERETVALSWAAETPVCEVVIGRAALPEDLARLAMLLGHRNVVPEVAFTLLPADARVRRACEESGIADALAGAGAHWLRDDEPRARRMRSGALRLHFAAGHEEPPSADDWHVSLQACAAAAACGRLEEWHRWPDVRGLEPPTAILAPGAARLPTAKSAEGANATRSTPATRPAESGDADARALRGPVALCWNEDLDAAALLPAGPRVEQLIDTPERLGSDILPGAPRGTGAAGIPRWLVVRGAVRDLEGAEAGLLALRALAVRGVLAAAIDARSRRLCSAAGLLALIALHPADLAEVDTDHELELVGGLDLATPGHARVVRDLTRARVLVGLPELDDEEWEWVRRGGRVRIDLAQ